jgi:type I restriction enzyme S subunit
MMNSQVRPGDIVFNITGASIARTCIIPTTLKIANISQHIALLRLRNANEPKFIWYYLQSQFVKDYVYLTQSGASKEAFNHGQMKCIPLPLPPLPEQTAIAAYLDKKTAQIDRQVELLSKKATQYGKLKQSLINETVTRGLDSSIPMKESGVEWIGEVPAHWEILRGKDIFEQTKNKAGLDSSSYDVLSLTLKGVIKRDLDNMKGKIPASFDGYQIANPGNLVLCLFDMDVTPRIVGYVNQLGIITSAYTVLRGLKNVDMKYFLYYYLEQNRNGSLLANSKTLRSTMTYDLFSQLQLPVPPITEQAAIAAYLDTKTAQIDRIVSTINTQIDKLKELRKTLINDVVTGKIKVIPHGELA